jgi:superfamily II DNA or RNA helicase
MVRSLMTSKPRKHEMGRLSEAERLSLQQLRLLEWAERRAESPAAPESVVSDGWRASSWLEGWELTRGLSLAPWQQSACDAWFAAAGRGTIKVVTGAGKTVVALAIAERLQREEPQLRIAIVVPTIVLMNQWHAVLLERSNLPQEALARLGGGHSETFDDGKAVLIAVLASARKELPRLVEEAGIGDRLLFVADECHRVGAPEMSAVLQTRRRFSLGLSATPERGEDADVGDDEYGRSTLGTELGPIVYEMTFAQAIEQGILPPFEIHHFGLSLNGREARQYEALTRSINDSRRELLASSQAARKAGGGEQLVAWARRVSSRGDSGLAGVASRFVNDTSRRKALLYRAESRALATKRLVQEALAARADARVILFHESIGEVVSLFGVLTRAGIPAVMEHSELPGELRETSLELFRAGTAQVIVSARSLIEGFNVPEADLGIIVASSSSARQRIQSIGRVLRKYRDAAGEQKSSRVCVLYVRDSVDEAIYEKEDWDRLIGLDRNRYFEWEPRSEPIERPGPPRAAIPTEEEIDLTSLRVGDPYPGRYDGAEFSADSQGNVSDPEGRVAANPQGIPALVAKLKGQAGRFKVTPRQQAVLVLVPAEGDGWQTLYGGVLSEPFEFGAPEAAVEFDSSELTAGEPYPGPVEPAEQLRFRQRGGGVVSRRARRGEVFARGTAAEQLAGTLRDLTRTRPITKIYVNDLGHAFWREDGVARFITALEDALEFPSEA